MQKNLGKSRDYSTAHVPIAANARTDELYEQFWRIPGYWIKVLCKIVSRFQSTWNDSEFSFVAQPRQKIAAWYMESIWITGERFWKSIFYVWCTSRFYSKNFIWRRAKKSRSSPWRSLGKNKSDKWRRTKLWHNSNANMCVKTVWLRVLNIQLIFRRTTWSDNKDSKFRNYNSKGSLIQHHSWCGKQDSKHRFQMVLIFRRKLCYGSQKWKWLILGWAGILTISDWKGFSKFRGRLPRLWTRSFWIPSSKRRLASRNRKPKRGPVPARKTDRLHDLRLLSSHWCSWHSICFCWFILCYSPWWQHFRNSIRDGTKFYYRWQKIHPMISWKVCANWRYVSLINSKPYWNCTTWRFIRRYRFPTIRSWMPWWIEVQIRNFVYETLTPDMGKLNLQPL